MILTTVVSVAVTILPLFASDFPSSDKRTYFKILQEWPMKMDTLIEQLRLEISKESVTGRVSAKHFIKKATQLKIYDVIVLREMVKTVDLNLGSESDYAVP